MAALFRHQTSSMQLSTTVWLSIWAIGVACFDAKYFRIPNALTLGAWVLGIAIVVLQHTTLFGESIGRTGASVAFATLTTLPAYALKKLGAADVKYLIAIALLTTLAVTIESFVVAALLGGAVSVAWLMLPRIAMLLLRAMERHPTAIQWLLKPPAQRRMPFGTLLSVGLIVALWR